MYNTLSKLNARKKNFRAFCFRALPCLSWLQEQAQFGKNQCFKLIFAISSLWSIVKFPMFIAWIVESSPNVAKPLWLDVDFQRRYENRGLSPDLDTESYRQLTICSPDST